MTALKRYRTGIAFDVLAEDDTEAVNIVKEMVKEMDRKEDNKPKVIFIEHIPFGGLSSREIDYNHIPKF